MSHENGIGTKITSVEPLKNSGDFIEIAFGSNTVFSSTNTIGTFLNVEYLTNYVDSTYSEMIEESSTWYLGTVGIGASYKMAKYTNDNMTDYATTANSKVGLLRLGELMAGQFDRYENNRNYWTLTPIDMSYVRLVIDNGHMNNRNPSNMNAVRPSLNLKSNVIITSGTGTKEDPFEIDLSE